MKRARAALASLVLLASVSLSSRAPAQSFAVEKYKLPNGMTVILYPDHTLPVAAINIWYRVGSKDEPARRSGFAHLFEHLMFMGTERVPNGEFDRIMEAAGGSNNASTERGPHELLLLRAGLAPPDAPLARRRAPRGPAARDGPEEGRPAARRRPERAAPELREPALRTRRPRDPVPPLPADPPVPLPDDRHGRGPQGRRRDGREGLLRDVLRPEQREPRRRGRLRPRGDQAARREALRKPPAREPSPRASPFPPRGSTASGAARCSTRSSSRSSPSRTTRRRR